ncbi:MAG: hypothetical protein NZM43_03295 [Saprospiraceae bacterium]|nr:hypothetical protein [Saprospiraceae bacterium]MDW8483329.1 hypothetical protein [Saprospiraceae bacterium]
MAIVEQAYYALLGDSLTSAEAVANPFHANFDVLGWNNFLQPPSTTKTIADTYCDRRERARRHLPPSARLTPRYGGRFYGITCNEHVAVCTGANS